jgi:hypothetical protein
MIWCPYIAENTAEATYLSTRSLPHQRTAHQILHIACSITSLLEAFSDYEDDGFVAVDFPRIQFYVLGIYSTRLDNPPYNRCVVLDGRLQMVQTKVKKVFRFVFGRENLGIDGKCLGLSRNSFLDKGITKLFEY